MFALVALAVLFSQSQVKVQVDAELLKCVTAYRAAVEKYRAGEDREAASAIAQLDRTELRIVVAVLLKKREIPANVADPHTNAEDPVGPFVWNTPTLLAAGVLHMDLARAPDRRTRPDEYRFHADLAHILVAAAARRQPGEAETVARRSALTVGLMLLADQNLAVARQHFADATKRWPDDIELLLTYGIVIETEASSPYSVQPPATAASMPRSRAGAIVLDPPSRERSARVALLRDAARLFERVLAIEETATEARIRLAHIRILQKDDDHAATLLEQALAPDPSPDCAYVGRLLLGDIRERAGQLQAAKQLYEGALSARPEGQSAYIALSHAMYAAGDHEAAEQMLDRLLSAHLTERAGDPWWGYALGRRAAVEGLFQRLRVEVRK